MIAEDQALIAFAALSDATRLDVLRFLIRSGPEGAAAGKVARALDVAPSRLSFHLKTLSEAQLVSGERRGKQVIYTAGFGTMQGLLAFLLEDCCGGAEALGRCCSS